MWTARVFTLYPELFPGPLSSGLYKKALEKKLWSLEVINIRDYALDKHKTVDDTPFGGGSGMVMRADVIANSLDKNISNKNEPIIYLSPKGKEFNHHYERLSLMGNVSLVDNQPFIHTHITFSDENFNTFGGHLFDCKIAAAGEFIIWMGNKKVIRDYNKELGLYLLNCKI